MAHELRGTGVLGVDQFRGQRTLVVDHGPMRLFDRAMKRALDLALTVPATLLALPLFAAIAIAGEASTVRDRRSSSSAGWVTRTGRSRC